MYLLRSPGPDRNLTPVRPNRVYPQSLPVKREAFVLHDIPNISCLEVLVHIHTPRLDQFTESVWEKTLKAKLQTFVGVEVKDITVIDLGERIATFMRWLEFEEPIDIDGLDLFGSFIRNGKDR